MPAPARCSPECESDEPLRIAEVILLRSGLVGLAVSDYYPRFVRFLLFPFA
jgi:hypothetical protein